MSKCARAVDHFRDALKDLPEACGHFAARHWAENYEAFNYFVPVASPAAVKRPARRPNRAASAGDKARPSVRSL